MAVGCDQLQHRVALVRLGRDPLGVVAERHALGGGATALGRGLVTEEWAWPR